MITHEFKFDIKQSVVALDYDEPRQEHNAVVTRRWLEENPAYMDNGERLLERYEVLIFIKDQSIQRAEFLVEDLMAR